MLSPNALTDVDAVKKYLQIDPSDTSLDDQLESLINACSTAIENYCRQSFGQREYTDEYDGTGTNSLFLANTNISSIIEVSIDGEIVDPSEYKLRKSGILVRLKNVWPIGILNVSVTYSAGFDQVPADLELACKHLVNFYYKTDISDYSTTFESGVVVRPEAWPVQVKALLAPYRRTLM